MMNFTNDEMNLMCIYSAGSSRAGLMQKLTEMKKYLELDEVQLLSLTESTLRKLGTMTDEEFVKIRADVNASFWAKYMSEVRGLFTISDAFYEASEEVEPKLYDPNWYRFKGTDPNEIDFYKYGVITYSENSYIDEDWPDFNSIYAPLKSEDLAQWMNFVFEKTPAEIQEICDKYPVMKKKYDVIREAMLENGFDLSKLEL